MSEISGVYILLSAYNKCKDTEFTWAKFKTFHNKNQSDPYHDITFDPSMLWNPIIYLSIIRCDSYLPNTLDSFIFNLNLRKEKWWLGLNTWWGTTYAFDTDLYFFLFVLGLFLIMNTHQNGYPHAFRQSIHCHFL